VPLPGKLGALEERLPYRFDELGWMQFERLCLELLNLFAGLSSAEWHALPSGRFLVLPEGVSLPGAEEKLVGPTGVLVLWVRPDQDAIAAAHSLRGMVQDTLNEWSQLALRSLLLLTNVSANHTEIAGVNLVTLGPQELSSLVSSSSTLRLRMPSVLGIGVSEDLIAPKSAARSTVDLEAALQIARVFAPTNAYAAALDVLERHHFTALTGPPEMGKTAIARMISLAVLTDGWEVHECNRPEELWARFARERQQLFIADDAFGSTEYRPEAAEHWALELDRVLQAMDERHWLIWTSRPAPLKAGLRRIHREHGIERFPQPAEIQVDAAELEVAEKAMILFRHARAAGLPERAVELIKAEGWSIVNHPHFTPERIRRFVGGRLLELAEQVGGASDIDEMVTAEIREPTAAMVASFRALSDEHRALLLALLDAPPGPVSERELLAAFRRHVATGSRPQPRQLIDRLTDHFVRLVNTSGVTWVHPSWRDLIIEELISDRKARQRFLQSCSIEGILLAISTAGGSAGERLLPLLRDDQDWDALSDRLVVVMPDLDEPGINRLLVTLAEAKAAMPSDDQGEIAALAAYALQRIAQRWNEDGAVIPVGVLASWFELAAAIPEPPPPPELAVTWIELLPGDRIDLHSPTDIARFDDWTALSELLQAHARHKLETFGFPEKQGNTISTFVDDVKQMARSVEHAARRELLIRILWRLSELAPEYAKRAAKIASRLAAVREQSEFPSRYTPRPISPELQRILDAPLIREPSNEALVARVLDDL
jgi:hypothetical protein